MLLAEVLDFPNQSFVKVNCCTTTADIYYHRMPDSERVNVRPSALQLQAIPYTLSGRIVGTESGETDYLVLESEGCAVVLKTNRSGMMKVAGLEVRKKLIHIPIEAIRRIIFQSTL